MAFIEKHCFITLLVWRKASITGSRPFKVRVLLGNDAVMSEAVSLNHVFFFFIVFYFLISVCVGYDLKSTNALYKMDMLHIALVNVECKTLKEKDLFLLL